MTVKEKLDEAGYFLKKIQEHNDPKKVKELYHNFSAYLSAIYSVWDYTLNEANRLYRLGLADDDTWYYSHFENKAKEIRTKDQRPLKYYKWFSKRKRDVDRTKIGRAFSKARQINIHKKSVFEIKIRIPEPPKWKKLPKVGGRYHSRGVVTVEYLLLVMGLGEMNFVKACEEYLETMKKFVADSRLKIEELKN